jgi:hypothetical protein
MSATTLPYLDIATMTACARSGPGRGCVTLRYSTCRRCGWTGELWDGDQPPLTDAAHTCPPPGTGESDG